MDKRKIVFSTNNYQYLLDSTFQYRDEIHLQKDDIDNNFFNEVIEGFVETIQYDTGESESVISSKVEGEDVYIISGIISDQDLLEICDLANQINSKRANSLSIIIPYFYYQETVKEDFRARILNLLSTSNLVNNKIKIYFFEPQDKKSLGSVFDKNEFDVKYISLDGFAKKSLKQVSSSDIVVTTSSNKKSWIDKVESFSNQNNVSFKGGDSILNAKEKNVFIYDETGLDSLESDRLAKKIKENNDSHVYLFSIHGLFVNYFLEEIKENGNIDFIFSTDTHPLSYSAFSNDLPYEIKSIASEVFKIIEQ